MPDGKKNLIDLLVRIPLFESLVPQECRRVLALCKRIAFMEGDVIFEIGDPGTRLIILLQGSVTIELGNGQELARLEPIDTIGEMEIASNHSRYARAVALTDISGMIISQNDLDILFAQDAVLGVKLLKNIVNSLAGKLAAINTKL
ncbi:MAG: cyclic nucleotide-binding domain-containing protein [Candidatus Latescibacteria bacterium]|jgi:CRP-like cAMP-binding protein|nr:cyclic nucleotide-binding domain-containing protein [Candidatus Latescibacterota bacterium]MBT4136899.1 cyclic nucleotide-binding domain-containing protein [Candidatus Latescibacterota bacterium]